MKGRVRQPEHGQPYYYIDLMTESGVEVYHYRSAQLDETICNRGLIYHDEESARYVAGLLLERIRMITE
jgi:hypothetical protein